MDAVDKFKVWNDIGLALVMDGMVKRNLPKKESAPSRSLIKYRKKRNKVNKIAAKSRKRNR